MICQKTVFEEELIEFINQDVINLPTEEISKIYSFWKNDFDKPFSQLSEEIKIVLDKSVISRNQKIPKESYLLGIDFPTWFNTPEHKLRILILGIDPLRNEQAFKKKANVDNDVIIGTPYALHCSKMRTGKTKHYWNFINLLSENNFVYLTDIYKTFFYTDNSKRERSYDYYKRNFPQVQKDLLKKEINLIKPDLIITQGANSFSHLLDRRAPKLTQNVESNITTFIEDNIRVDVLPMVHLSGSTRKKTKLDFLKKNDVNIVEQNFGKDYFQIVKNYLNKHKKYLTLTP